MPKQPGGVAKFNRIEILRQVLTRWGRLNKTRIDQDVAAAIGCEPEAVGRALYRDLEDLVAAGEVKVSYFTRDGVEIADFDPETHKNFVCEWAMASAQSVIMGAQRLEDSKVSLLSSSRLARELVVSDGRGELEVGSVNLYFRAGGKAHRLTLRKDAFPFQIVFARATQELSGARALEKLEDWFGKRTIVLLFQIPSLSSVKNALQKGHLAISMQAPGKLELRELGSKNGVHFQELNAEQCAGLVAETCTWGDHTSTDAISPDRLAIQPRSLRLGQAVELAFPLLVQLSSSLEILIA